MESNSKILDAKKAKSQYYILTYHCDEHTPWEDILRSLYASGKYNCVAGQLERGKKDGKIHIQGFISCKTRTQGSTVLKQLPSGSWFKAPNKWNRDPANTAFRMYSYATKEDTRVSISSLTLGEPPQHVDNSLNGKRGRDIQKETYGEVLQLAREGKMDEIMQDYPDLYIKHLTTLKKICVDDKIIQSYEFPHQIRQWQQLALDLLKNPDDRTIHWFYDPVGNAGKSTFLKWLSASGPHAFYLDGGKKQDNMFLLKEHHTLLLCDIPRHGKDYVPYSTMETFKNGIWTATKYEGNRVHRRLPGSVLVVANFLPEIHKLSEDRWDIYHIKKDYTCVFVPYIDCIPNEYGIINYNV